MTPPDSQPPVPLPQSLDVELPQSGPRPLNFAATAPPLVAGKPPAGFWLRFWARIADTMPLNFAFSVLALALAVGHAYGSPGGIIFVLLIAGSFLPAVVYFSYYQSAGRQSLGYYLAGIQALDEQGQPLRWQRSCGRTLLSWFFAGLCGCAIGLADYAALAFSPDKRALHDRLTDSSVVRVAPPKITLLAFCCALGMLPLIAVRMSCFPFQSFYIPARSMEPTLRVNDRLLVNRVCYRLRPPRYGDLVVFRAPPAALRMSADPVNIATPDNDVDFIKRCMGTPGDVVYLQNRKYYRNGQLLHEPYVKWVDGALPPYDMKIVDGKIYYRDSQSADGPGPWMQEQEPVELEAAQRIEHAPPGKVPPGQFLMLGDNRGNSLDSHFWGFVPRANLVGKVMVIFWPPERAKGF